MTGSRAVDTKLGREGFDRVYKKWGEDEFTHEVMESVNEFGKNAYGIIARRCAKLTEREAITVLKALQYEGIGFQLGGSNPVALALQRKFGRLVLSMTISRFASMAPACCALDPEGTNPYPEIVTAFTNSQSNIKNVGHALFELFFGQSARNGNVMRGNAISLLCHGRIVQEEYEWFGANWKRVIPAWEQLLDESFITRSRAEILTDKNFRDVPYVLMDGAL